MFKHRPTGMASLVGKERSIFDGRIVSILQEVNMGNPIILMVIKGGRASISLGGALWCVGGNIVVCRLYIQAF